MEGYIWREEVPVQSLVVGISFGVTPPPADLLQQCAVGGNFSSRKAYCHWYAV